eukprot:Clim_evm231s157 gene=Clim_evmTU231s157
MPPHNEAFPSKRQKLNDKVQAFKLNVDKYLQGTEPSKVVLASAWLISDNVIVDLFKRFAPEHFPTVVAVDTLHLFPETHDVLNEMEEKYDFKTKLYKPVDCETQEDFNKKFGKHEVLTFADFDKHSKIEPITRGFEEAQKEIVITGRRMDQGNARTEMAIFEEDKKTFNPLAEWSWEDVVDYVMANNVPYNPLHKKIYISGKAVKPINRDDLTQFQTKVLDRPYFSYAESEINSYGANVYVWKSFGDIHSTVPVAYSDSERAGRFVGREQTECGIHTRVAGKHTPHGGVLINCLVGEDHTEVAQHYIEMTERQVCDFELISNGGFSPLKGFMTKVEYDKVVAHMRLPEEQLFGLPVTMDTDNEALKVGDVVELTYTPFNAKGYMTVTDKWIPDRSVEGEKVYGTASDEHPAVNHLLNEKKKYNIGGPVRCVRLPQRDWVKCVTPKELRARNGDKNVIAFQSRNPLHRAHVEMFIRVAAEYDAEVLVHPVIGPTKGDDVPATVRKQTYDVLAQELDHVQFEYLPYNMMVGGPREALQHALVRKNYGCTGMIVGRDHAGCKNKAGEDFYGPYEAHDLLKPLAKELGMDIVFFMQMVYTEETKSYIPIGEAKQAGYSPMSISGTKFRKMLTNGDHIPEWFAFPNVVAILRQYYSSE